MADFERAQIIQLAHDTFDESGFTFSVFSYERHFLAAPDSESDIMKDRMLPEVFSQILYYEREVSAARGRREA